MSRKYVITETSEASAFDWNQLVDIDESHSRKSVDGSKIIARFEGTTPSFLEGKTVYTHSEMIVITQTSEWTPTPE